MQADIWRPWSLPCLCSGPALPVFRPLLIDKHTTRIPSLVVTLDPDHHHLQLHLSLVQTLCASAKFGPRRRSSLRSRSSSSCSLGHGGGSSYKRGVTLCPCMIWWLRAPDILWRQWSTDCRLCCTGYCKRHSGATCCLSSQRWW